MSGDVSSMPGFLVAVTADSYINGQSDSKYFFCPVAQMNADFTIRQTDGQCVK